MFISRKGTVTYKDKQYDLPIDLFHRVCVLQDKRIGDPKVQELFEKILLYINDLEKLNEADQ